MSTKVFRKLKLAEMGFQSKNFLLFGLLLHLSRSESVVQFQPEQVRLSLAGEKSIAYLRVLQKLKLYALAIVY